MLKDHWDIPTCYWY